jgi:hypothetical protein
VWEDRDEEDVTSYKTLEGHKSDILAMAAYAPRQLLATGARALPCRHVNLGLWTSGPSRCLLSSFTGCLHACM